MRLQGMCRFEAAKPHDARTQAFKRSLPTPDAKRTCRPNVSPGERNEEEWLHQRRNKGLKTRLLEWRF